MEIGKLISGIKNGDVVAEQQLYTLLYEDLFKVPLAYCKDKDEATFVFNHSMLYIFKHIKPFTKQINLIKWAHRILKNDCIDQIRKSAVYQNKLSAIGKKEDQWITNEAISKLHMADILACIQQLDNSCRLCFVLYVLEGYTHKEVAEKLGINQNTAKWYFSEAKKKLRKLLEGKGITSYAQTQSNF